MKSEVNINIKVSFVYLVKNEESRIEQSIKSVIIATENARISNYEIVVVNDGSTDDTVKVIENLKNPNIKIYSQENKGRLKATVAGINKATFEHIVIMGARVILHPNCLKYVKGQLAKYPERKVWTSDVSIPRSGINQAGLWSVVTYVTWKKYYSNPKLSSFGIEDFDYYPKGTGAFFVPKRLVQEAYESLESIYNNAKFANDDTSMMRYVAAKEKIYISPDYGADYMSRSDLKSFIKHTYHRGTVLLDGYLRPGTRLFYPLIMYFIVSIAAIFLIATYPLYAIYSTVITYAVAVIILSTMKLKMSDRFSFLVLAPIFILAYSAGIYRGLYELLSQKFLN